LRASDLFSEGGGDEIAAEFPDCEVMREVEGARWQKRNAEFEHESRNFLLVELSREVRKLWK
jgi:hypothetical protein